MTVRKSSRIASLTALMLLLAACGGGGNSTAGEEGDASDDSSTSTTVAESDDGGGGADTLASYLGWDTGDDPEAAEASWREQEAVIQESVRLCMAEEGFDYIPVEPPADSYVVDDRTPEDWAAEQGFGISTWIGNEEQFSGPDVEYVDPNQEIVEAMSESEMTAYYEALHGSEEENAAQQTTEIDPETGEEITYSEGFGGGCYGAAYEAEYGGQNDLYEELGPEMDAMYQRIQADPRILALDVEWSECMVGKGYEYESQNTMYEAVYEDFQARLDAIVGPNGGYVDPFEGWTEDEINAFFEEKSEEEINAFFEAAENQAAPEYDEAALAALQQEERDLAVAAAECQGNWEEVYMEVSAEYESEFIAANQAKLDEIKSSLDGQG
ncbi:MAG: hypothetical protein ACFCVC_06005 [Acidimicrobiia bacterium]